MIGYKFININLIKKNYEKGRDSITQGVIARSCLNFSGYGLFYKDDPKISPVIELQ